MPRLIDVDDEYEVPMSDAQPANGRTDIKAPLRELADLRPLYILPRDDFVAEVLIPCLQRADAFTCMFGYFGSGALRDIAPGLAAYLQRSTGRIRMLVSPHLQAGDLVAIREGLSTPADVLKRRLVELLGEARLSESALVHHTLACLAYLLSAGRLEVKIAYLPEGIFHPKVWFFRDPSGVVVAHGSSNFTDAGLRRNHEQIRVERSWAGPDQAAVIEGLFDEYESLWNDQRDYAVCLELPVAVRENLIREHLSERPPTHEDFQAAWEQDARRARASGTRLGTTRSSLVIPPGLEYDSGPFAHQGSAVRAWERAGRRGILAMATGSGKTIASLVAATRLVRERRPLLLVIAAPFRPLVEQWEDEVRSFGVEPLPLASLSGSALRQRLEAAVRSLSVGVADVEVAVVTHDFLTSTAFRSLLREVPERVRGLLIADEVHNLGRPMFVAEPPEWFEYRLGLSATPERQYDPEGTAGLFDFFGDVVFEFSLADAIGVCLVEYDYYLHPVELSPDELERWEQLTERLQRAGFGTGDSDPSDSGELSPEIIRLLVQRRAVLETAEAKLGALGALLGAKPADRIRHTLVYTSDKNPQQILDVNRLLGRDLGILFHQLTDAETSSRRTTRQLLERFGAGEFQVLTCKRVLDEGVDIPQVAEAFLLASSTVRRQWVQRRGRILRRCDAIGKTKAVLHDFLVVPADQEHPGGRAILRQELVRAREFAVLAANAGSDNGPFQVMQDFLADD
jgi:superfamily II DNA or RNA helicase